MIIKPFSSQLNSVDDIENLRDIRRYIILYKYRSPHKINFFEEVYGGDLYDVYLVNSSSIDGHDFIVPSKYILHTSNAYRGKATNCINKDGSLNKSAVINFYSGSYANKIHDKTGGNVMDTFSTISSIHSGGTSEQSMTMMLNSDLALPFPCYYNIEDQAKMAASNFKDCDFLYNFCEVPSYTIGDLIDNHTVCVNLEVDGDDKNVLFGGPTAKFQDDSKVIDVVNLGDFKDTITSTFIKCFESVLFSIFSQAYFIFDLQSGLFSIPETGLRVKYSYGIDKHVITKAYADLLGQGSCICDGIDWCSQDVDTPMHTFETYDRTGRPMYDMMPDKLMVFISTTSCKIKMTCTSLYGMSKRLSHTSDCSSSDGDTLSQSEACDGQIYPGQDDEF